MPLRQGVLSFAGGPAKVRDPIPHGVPIVPNVREARIVNLTQQPAVKTIAYAHRQRSEIAQARLTVERFEFSACHTIKFCAHGRGRISTPDRQHLKAF